MDSENKPATEPQSKQVNDVAAPPKPVQPVISEPPTSAHLNVHPAPDGAQLTTPKAEGPKVSAPSKPVKTAKKDGSHTAGIVAMTIVVMLALSALAVLAYMHNKA